MDSLTMPRCLAVSQAKFVSEASDPVFHKNFQIHCSKCGAGAFGLIEMQKGGSAIGLILSCEACGKETNIFDGLQHGYDGELGQTEHLDGDSSHVALYWNDGTPKRHDRIFAQFTYNIEQSELDEISKEEGIAVVNLFDWFSIFGNDTKTGEVMWEYECA